MRAAHRLIVATLATAIVLSLTLTPTHRASGTTKTLPVLTTRTNPTTTVEATTTTTSTTLAPVATITTVAPTPPTYKPKAAPVIPRSLVATAACIIRHENGGSYGRSTNPNHFGKYQFSTGTWAAYGGNPKTWGTATPAEQDAVFARAMATPGGYLNWTKYDGC